ncbi:MAG: hypothetical protein A2928_04340 [Candidatus Taylorbacteria bacterium RIFCSPLOWO2_01_FULL_45_15b]|uniref:Phosphoglycerate mutase n=1 Tax=Candidatus Taylorbacteria bacterium RIFCSPLOWO2_01_FULL_45_15b TaxID=1802319 RepID=A0A1G2NGJ7_9BACT|nr:MAG: hypothetical protein A2928_04340 [Candidatus Taylorbacteria bacterium RIFCSPLOWO2_01_FULL_45_15b]
MKRLIVARHVRPDQNGRVNYYEGIKSVEELCEAIQRQFQNLGQTVILTSTLSRARDTAEILSKKLGADVGAHPELSHDALEMHEEKKKIAVALVMKSAKQYDTVIVVTHHSSTWCIPREIAFMWYESDREKWNVFNECERFTIAEYACANVLDMETGKAIANLGWTG